MSEFRDYAEAIGLPILFIIICALKKSKQIGQNVEQFSNFVPYSELRKNYNEVKKMNFVS